ncbi:MAG: hypothetical protein ACRD30_07890 [Bryobacteraceae bacterium]
MKKFSFPLGRVKDWRETQARIEESKLERLYAELRAIDAQDAVLREQRSQSEKSVLSASANTALELSALHSFCRFAVAEHTRLEHARADCAKRIAAQIQAVASRRRDVKLLERLKDQRLARWQADLSREIDAESDEAFLAKWSRI